MSYNPVSFNVIRQSVKWANMPTPALKRESMYKLPDGTMTAQYSATFKRVDVDNWYSLYTGLPLVKNAVAEFASELNNCFCADILVNYAVNLPEDGTVVAMLHVRMARHGGAE